MKLRPITSPARALTDALSERTREQRRGRKAAVALERVATGFRRNDLLPQLKFEQRAPSSLHPPARNVRKVSSEHVAEIARSMAAFGVVRPVLISGDGTIVDGVSTVEAARTLGLEALPCLIIDHLSSVEVQLLRNALNRLGEKGDWDIDTLKLVMTDLIDLGAPIELSGFTLPEIDLVLAQDEPILGAAGNRLPNMPTTVVSRLGDRWMLGPHSVACADATKPESYPWLKGSASIRAVFTDPPYNVKINGFAVGAGQHREFLAASGEMTDDEFVSFLATFLRNATAYLSDAAVLYVCMDWRHAEHVQRAARHAGLSHINTVVWAKGNAGLGGLYRSAHEFVFVLKYGEGPILNNVELGKHGRDRTNLWHYPGANQRGSSAHAQAANHPTPKPVELVADALLDVTNRGDIVLDPFAGSGTTIIAAHKTGRIACALELDPSYVDLIITRFQDFTGIDAVHAETGQTFAEVAIARGSATSDFPMAPSDTAAAAISDTIATSGTVSPGNIPAAPDTAAEAERTDGHD